MDLWVFDNDGTLYDDSEAHKSFVKILSEYTATLYRVPVEEASERLSRVKSKWNTSSAAIALAREFKIPYPEVVKNTYLKIDLEQCGVPKSDPVRKKVLGSLSGKKVVFTNNPSVFARRVLSRLHLDECFCDIVGIEKTGFLGKPDRRAFKSLEFRHPKHDRIIFCDDSLKNLGVAHQMGWITIWFNPAREVDGDSKHIIAHSFEEIESLV